jgi:Tol biopolymer transport system component
MWLDGTYYYPPELGARPKTLDEALEARWFSMNGPEEELSLPLDTLDLRPEGIVYASLDGAFCFSPDSKSLAAICARHLYVIDLESGESREIHFDGEEFGPVAWIGSREIVYTTDDGTTMRFWRYQIDFPPEGRVEVYQERSRLDGPRPKVTPRDKLPIMHHLGYDYSPDGQAVLFESAPTYKEALLNLNTGVSYPVLDHALYRCWKPDGSGVLIYGSRGKAEGYERKVLLVNSSDGQVDDLTERFEEVCGEDMDLTFVSPRWLPDGKSVVFYNTTSVPYPGSGPPTPDGHTSYVVQVDPWRVILTQDGFLRWAPVPGWVLLQGSDDFEWLDYAGTTRARLKGWPNDWIWSPDGKHAAEVRGRNVVVFSPPFPPGD